MSSGNANQEQLDEGLGVGVMEDVPAGKLEDAEIQRLVALSNDASYARSDRIPVKTVEAFEPRSLVSIAMAAQRRRESEMRTAMAAGAVIEDAAGEAAGETPGEISGELADAATEATTGPGPAGALGSAGDTDGDTDAGVEGVATDETTGQAHDEDAAEASSTSQVDFEAGRAEGLEEGRKVGFDEGHAKGMEEGRAAGRAEASAQLERAVQAFEAATARLADLTEIDSATLSDSIHKTILQLASERAGHAIAQLPDSFANRIETLLATIRTVSGQPSIRLNPGDFASIQPLAETREKLRHCNFVADPALAPGDLSVMIGTIGIDDMILDPKGPAKTAEETEAKPEDGHKADAGPTDMQSAAQVTGTSDDSAESPAHDPADNLAGNSAEGAGDKKDV